MLQCECAHYGVHVQFVVYRLSGYLLFVVVLFLFLFVCVLAVAVLGLFDLFGFCGWWLLCVVVVVVFSLFVTVVVYVFVLVWFGVCFCFVFLFVGILFVCCCFCLFVGFFLGGVLLFSFFCSFLCSSATDFLNLINGLQ